MKTRNKSGEHTCNRMVSIQIHKDGYYTKYIFNKSFKSLWNDEEKWAKNLNKYFTEEETWTTNTHTKDVQSQL